MVLTLFFQSLDGGGSGTKSLYGALWTYDAFTRVLWKWTGESVVNSRRLATLRTWHEQIFDQMRHVQIFSVNVIYSFINSIQIAVCTSYLCNFTVSESAGHWDNWHTSSKKLIFLIFDELWCKLKFTQTHSYAKNSNKVNVEETYCSKWVKLLGQMWINFIKSHTFCHFLILKLLF